MMHDIPRDLPTLIGVGGPYRDIYLHHIREAITEAYGDLRAVLHACIIDTAAQRWPDAVRLELSIAYGNLGEPCVRLMGYRDAEDRMRWIADSQGVEPEAVMIREWIEEMVTAECSDPLFITGQAGATWDAHLMLTGE